MASALGGEGTSGDFFGALSLTIGLLLADADCFLFGF